VVGREGRATAVLPLRNVENSPVRYRLDPQEQLHLLKWLDEEDLEMLAIYHSHPASEAYPSATDVELAYWDECVYLIISLLPPTPTVRAFRLVEGEITEVSLEVGS